MFRLTLLRRAIVCFFIHHAVQSGGFELHPTDGEVIGPLEKDVVHGPTKQYLMGLKSKSIEATIFGQGSSSWVDPYFVGHQTPYGGPKDNYYGLHATMDVYGHKLKPGQLSSTTFWIFHDGDGNTSSRNTIQVGWHIHPELYGDSHPHFYTLWTVM
uniref:Uncharacterized protein n=1 Tax=Avena sativa TaxID=4498 RepID=A0ACD5TU09_AVESA